MSKRVASLLLAVFMMVQVLAVSVAAEVVGSSDNGDGTYTNAFLNADVPDLDIIRVDDAWWMSSTTMHMNPGVPIMKSYDLVNWETVSYVYNIMEDTNATRLQGTSQMYSNGTWASSLRYKDGTFYLVVPSNTSQKTYIFQNTDPENLPWDRYEINRQFHDCGLLMDDDGRNWLIWGNLGLQMIELNADVTGLAEGATAQTFASRADLNDLIRHPETGAQLNHWLLEGAHFQKVGDNYFIFLIGWANGTVRHEVALRTTVAPEEWLEADFDATDAFEAQVVAMESFSGDGVAQGGIVDDEDGNWWGFVFRDSGPVGRAPWLMPITWEDGWPFFGQDEDGKGTYNNIKMTGEKPVQGVELKSIVFSDEFDNDQPRPVYYDSELPTRAGYEEGEYEYNGSNLHLAWQWNHNPDNRYWSLTEREGWLRLNAMLNASATNRNILNARNTLTQRTFGPESGATTLLDVSGMKEGDQAGLTVFAAKYGSIGVVVEDGEKFIVTKLANGWTSGHATDRGVESARVPLAGDTVYLKAEAYFPLAPIGEMQPASFYYSYDGARWTKLGDDLQMVYSTANHFMGYRFGLYSFATTEEGGGYADFDFFRLSDTNTGVETGESDLLLATTAHNVQAGEFIPITVAFREEQPANTVILNFTFDAEKFRYNGYSVNDVENVSQVDYDFGEGWAKVTLMAPGYDMEDLGYLGLVAKEDAVLARERQYVNVTAEYVLKDENGDKSVAETKANVSFTTGIDRPFLADTNDDGVVDILDLSNIIDWFGYTPENQADWDDWYTYFDFNNNGEIDISDIVFVARLI